MTSELYVMILDKTLVPFIAETFPDNHKLMQDNDPKHEVHTGVLRAQKYELVANSP